MNTSKFITLYKDCKRVALESLARLTLLSQEECMVSPNNVCVGRCRIIRIWTSWFGGRKKTRRELGPLYME